MVYHPRYLIIGESVYQHLRLFHILHPLGDEFVCVALLIGVGTEALDRFQQVIHIGGLTSPLLVHHDEPFDVDGFQLFQFLHSQGVGKIGDKEAQLFFIIADGARGEVPHLTVENKFLNKPFREHSKITSFCSKRRNRKRLSFTLLVFSGFHRCRNR